MIEILHMVEARIAYTAVVGSSRRYAKHRPVLAWVCAWDHERNEQVLTGLIEWHGELRLACDVDAGFYGFREVKP